MSKPRDLIWRGARYRFCGMHEIGETRGRRLSGDQAVRLVRELIQAGDEAPIRALYAAHVGEAPHRTSNEALLRWFASAVGAEGAPSITRLAVVALSGSGSEAAPSRPPTAADEREAARVVVGLLGLGIRELVHRGERFVLAPVAEGSLAASRGLGDAFEPQQAATRLAEMAAAPARSEKLRALLTRAAALAAAPSGAALVLWRLPSGSAGSGASDAPPPSSAVTPSQLRRTPPPPPDIPTDWLELRLVDDAGQPLAGEAYAVTFSDGSAREGVLDAAGSAFLAGVPAGTCTVSFPAFRPHAAE